LRKVFDKNGLGLDHTLLLSQRDVDMENIQRPYFVSAGSLLSSLIEM
jgi:hypothetical protein